MRSLIFVLAICFTFGLSAQKKEIEVGNFTDLTFGTSGTLYLSQGPDTKVIVEASERVLDKIVFDVRGDRLVIKYRDNQGGWNSGIRRSDLTVYVTMRDIEAVTLNGSGPIIGENTLKTEDLEVRLSGSGSMELEVDSRDMKVILSGSGAIELAGSGDEVNAVLSGSGKIRADELRVSTLDASISGSGSIYMDVQEEIDASISGSGNVYYLGKPDRVLNRSTGSGKVKRM